MIQTFITHKGTNDLILFFAGWGMDTQPFAELKHIGCDCCICYDYTHLDFDTTPLLDYKNIEVYAWSFGVWAASFVLQNSNLPIRRAVAINGTTYGIDREKGISPEIFQATLNNLDEANLNKFYRRMCYGSDMLNLFLEQRPTRNFTTLYDELAAIGHAIATNAHPHFHWDEAIIGIHDRIFPKENQTNAWQGDTAIQEIDAGHYLHFRPIILRNRLDKQVIQKCFEKAAATYEEEGRIQSRIACRLNELIPDMPEKEKKEILEIGCGTGKLTRLLFHRFPQARFTVNDLSAEMKNHLSELHLGNWEFWAGDAEKIDFEREYDLIVSASTIQWFTDLNGFLKRISGKLSNDGNIAFSTFVAGNLPEIKSLSVSEMPYWESPELKRMFEKYFDVDRFEEEEYQLRFDTPIDLLRHLKKTGVTGVSSQPRHRGFNFIKRYRETFGEKKEVTLTYRPVYIIAHKKSQI